jgi:hypothetical protein
MFSEDGSKTFETMGVPSPIMGVDFDTISGSYTIVGARGMIAVTPDRGRTYDRLSRDATLRDGPTGEYAACYGGRRLAILNSDGNGLLTLDSGRTWMRKQIADEQNLKNLIWCDSTTVFATSGQGSI